MSLAALNKHTWMEYRYQYANDNSLPRKMWTCDSNNIFETPQNTYVLVANNGVKVDNEFSDLEAAKRYVDERL